MKCKKLSKNKIDFINKHCKVKEITRISIPINSAKPCNLEIIIIR